MPHCRFRDTPITPTMSSNSAAHSAPASASRQTHNVSRTSPTAHKNLTSILISHHSSIKKTTATMASHTFNLKTALLLTPLVSSTSTLLLSFDHHTFFSPFVHPTVVHNRPAGSNTLLPAYWKSFFVSDVSTVVAFLGITTWTSVGCIYSSRQLLRGKGSLAWYAGAAALATAHLLFVPWVMGPIRSILDNEGGDVDVDAEKKPGDKKSNIDTMNGWLRINMARTLTTDLGAWVCAVIAVTKTFS